MSNGLGGDPARAAKRDLDDGVRLKVARIKEGDPVAFRQLYQQEERRAFVLAMRVVGDPAVAEDAVQEAFSQLWQRAGHISIEGGRIESLLMTIVRRRAIDLARRRGKGERPLPDPELLEQVDERATAMLERVEDNLTSEGLRSALRRALETLPDEQRTIVRQAYFGELTLSQIAEREGLPLGTVKSRLRLAMAKLTEIMRRQGAR